MEFLSFGVHIGKPVPHGSRWRIKCDGCPWVSEPAERISVAAVRFNDHVVTARAEHERAAERAEKKRRTERGQRSESLARAQARIRRCGGCGEWTFDERCTWCITRLTSDEAKRFEAALDREQREIPELAELLREGRE